MLTEYIFKELLELLDLNWRPHGIESGCPVVHLLPRFVRESEDGSSAELLSTNVILEHWMIQSQIPLFQPSDLLNIRRIANSEWSTKINDLRGTLAWKPGAVCSSLFSVSSLNYQFINIITTASLAETASYQNRSIRPYIIWVFFGKAFASLLPLPLLSTYDIHTNEAKSFSRSPI